ncbi:MAG: cation:proton antiporter [Deltaproteobacteria bacterium]|nr:cation:proton antiporter [Deltaproteobacteria bacterium]
MESLSHLNLTVMFLALGVLLGMARILGELAQRLHQPAILGELLAGVLLGPTVLGNIAPEGMGFLFPGSGPNAIALEAVTSLAIALFLLVAGLEVDLSTIWRQGRLGISIGIGSIVVPFSVGFAGAWFFPQIMGGSSASELLTFALFFATALSISALPVIAKTLMDMGLYRSDLGMVVVSAAVFNDIFGWIVFAVILGMMDTVGGHGHHIGITITLTLLFAAAMLTLGRRLVHRLLPFLQAYTQWPGGVLSFALTLALLGAAVTEWIGIHAIFGAFLVGVAIGDSSHLRERTRVTIDYFVSFIFAPLFFAGIGLKVDFLANFDPLLVLTILVIACTCKLGGGYAGARRGGMMVRESWAVAFAMNSQGAMGIILGLLALRAGLIDDRLFVALVVMAMVTSMISGTGMRLILRPKTSRRLQNVLAAKNFLRELKGDSRRRTIAELAAVAAENLGRDAEAMTAAVWEREQTMSTGIGNGVALPHARIAGLREPLVVAGISDSGIDFDAPDGKPAHIIFLLLTPDDDPVVHLELTADIARLARRESLAEQLLRTKNYTDFLALIKNFSTAAD